MDTTNRHQMCKIAHDIGPNDTYHFSKHQIYPGRGKRQASHMGRTHPCHLPANHPGMHPNDKLADTRHSLYISQYRAADVTIAVDSGCSSAQHITTHGTTAHHLADPRHRSAGTPRHLTLATTELSTLLPARFATANTTVLKHSQTLE